MPSNERSSPTSVIGKLSIGCPLRTPQTLPAIEAFVARAVADGDVAAVRAGRRVFLEMPHGVTQRDGERMSVLGEVALRVARTVLSFGCDHAAENIAVHLEAFGLLGTSWRNMEGFR